MNNSTKGRYENGFVAPGIDTDISDPQNLYRQLYADLRYLGNSAYPRIQQGKRWGEWDKEALRIYFAKILDALEEAGRPITPPDEDDPKWDTSYWKLYQKAQPYRQNKLEKLSRLIKAGMGLLIDN